MSRIQWQTIKQFLFRYRFLFGLLFLQTALVTPLLDSRPLWLDEAYSALLAQHSIAQIHEKLQFDAGPPLFYDTLHLWQLIIGTSEIDLRLFSLLFALITTVFVYLIANQFFGFNTAMIASLFWVLSPLSIFYAYEVRNYTLLSALFCGYAYCLAQFIIKEKDYMLYVGTLLLILLIYTHNIGWFVVCTSLLVLFLFRNQWNHKKQLLVSALIIFIVYIPWLPTLITQLQSTQKTIDWVAQVWHPNAVLMSLWAFIPGGPMPIYMPLPSLPYNLQVVSIFIWLIPIFLLLVSIIIHQDRSTRLLTAFVFLSFIGPYIVSLLQTPIYLVARTDFFILPLLLILLAHGITILPWKLTQVIYVGIFLLQAIVIIGLLYTQEIKYTEKEIADYLARQLSENDVVLTTGLSRPAVEYYLADTPATIQSYPQDMENHLAHFNESIYLAEGQEPLKQEVLALLNEMDRSDSLKTLWIIYSQRLVNEPIDLALQEFQKQHPSMRISPPIQTAKMGIQRLQEPLYLIRIQFANQS